MLVFLVDNIENNFFFGLFFTVWITCLLVRWNLTKLDDLQTLDGYNERAVDQNGLVTWERKVLKRLPSALDTVERECS